MRSVPTWDSNQNGVIGPVLITEAKSSGVPKESYCQTPERDHQSRITKKIKEDFLGYHREKFRQVAE
jgi:hypothetical protein